MLFITNREPKGDITFEKNRKIDFDLDKNAPSNSLYFCKRDNEFNYKEIGANSLMQGLRDDEAMQILLYIHGFSNLPEPDIFPRAIRLQQMFDEKEKNLVRVVPIIWPCDNDCGIVRDYWDDQKSADNSAYSFARAFEMFLKWREESGKDICIKRINILAHSMGNRVLRQTLAAWSRYDLASGVPLLFRNSFLVAADIVNESLEYGQAGELISHASRNVSVYYASDDLALRASKASNLKNKIASRRLGHTGPESMRKIPNNVYAIDCDDINTEYDHPIGHSYFLNDPMHRPGKVFEHIFNTIKTGRVHTDYPLERRHILQM